MKKILLMLMMALMFLDVSVAQVVESVAGIEFGTDKSSARSKLFVHFGYDYDEEGDVITFHKVRIGGIFYDFATFYFRYSKFVSADFYSVFDLSKVNDAKAKRDNIFSTYSKKYWNNEERTNDAGFKYYVLGDSQYENDNHFPIVIYVGKSKSKDGTYFYYVNTAYYIHLLDYSDEI